ncbi:MAG TPA: hypothetical protein VGN04_09725 [Herbaspirillum sp.]
MTAALSPAPAAPSAPSPPPIGGRLKRLFAILAFAAGGVAAELAAPLQCTLMPAGSVAIARRAARSAPKRRKV